MPTTTNAPTELMGATGTALTDATTGPARAIAGAAPTVRALVEASISDNTRRAYTGAIRRIDAALAGRSLNDESLAEYIASQHNAGRAPASAALTVAALKFRSKLEGVTSPVGPMTGRVLAGIRRDGRGRGQVAGVQWAQAREGVGTVRRAAHHAPCWCMGRRRWYHAGAIVPGPSPG